MSSSAPAVKHILPPALSQGRQCLAALESRSDYPVIHHVTLTPGAQWSEVKTSSRWYNAGPAMSANHLSHSLLGGDRFFFFLNSTHSVQERLGGCVSPGAMASVTHARTHLWYADILWGLKEENGEVSLCVCEETSREVKGGIVILVVPKVTSEDKQENRERRRVNPRWPCCVYPGCPVAPPSLPTMPDLLPSNLLTVSQVRTFVDKENIS